MGASDQRDVADMCPPGQLRAGNLLTSYLPGREDIMRSEFKETSLPETFANSWLSHPAFSAVRDLLKLSVGLAAHDEKSVYQNASLLKDSHAFIGVGPRKDCPAVAEDVIRRAEAVRIHVRCIGG